MLARYKFLYSISRPALRAVACGGRPRPTPDRSNGVIGMSATRNNGAWFWTLIDRFSNILTVLSALWVTMLGLAGGLMELVFKFSLPWRVITLIGLAGLLMTVLAVIASAARRWKLLRPLQAASQSPGSGSTMFQLDDSGSGLTLVGNVAEGIDTFFHGSGPVQDLRAAANVQRASPGQPEFARQPTKLDQDGLQRLANRCEETAREISDFLIERERVMQQYQIPSGDMPHNEKVSRLTQAFTETMAEYRKHFHGRVITLLELAADNGYGNPALERYLRPTVNVIEARAIADGLNSIAERIRFLDTESAP
jgi:hypothetical protein